MESDINWLNLPVEMWELIFCNLKVKCLLRASETCKKFNDVLSNSQRLMKRISLTVGHIFMYDYIKQAFHKNKVYEYIYSVVDNAA